jgi:hypothetical protein
MQGKIPFDIYSSIVSRLAELGDYTNDEHSIENISDFHFLPDQKQTQEFEEQVLHKWITYKY